jgi:hypothetical protein
MGVTTIIIAIAWALWDVIAFIHSPGSLERPNESPRHQPCRCCGWRGAEHPCPLAMGGVAAPLCCGLAATVSASFSTAKALGLAAAWQRNRLDIVFDQETWFCSGHAAQ